MSAQRTNLTYFSLFMFGGPSWLKATERILFQKFCLLLPFKVDVLAHFCSISQSTERLSKYFSNAMFYFFLIVIAALKKIIKIPIWSHFYWVQEFMTPAWICVIWSCPSKRETMSNIKCIRSLGGDDCGSNCKNVKVAHQLTSWPYSCLRGCWKNSFNKIVKPTLIVKDDYCILPPWGLNMLKQASCAGFQEDTDS